MLKNVQYVTQKLQWMKEENIWPNGDRYLWTDAFGIVLLCSLYTETGDTHYLDESIWLTNEVYRVLGRQKGLRIGEEPDRYGQYFHYLAMWIYALNVMEECYQDNFRDKAIQLVKDIHPHFFIPDVGVYWKLKEDLSGPSDRYGLGALDHFHGYVVYSLTDPDELSSEIADMKSIIDKTFLDTIIDQDLGLGMMLWMTHFFPEEKWAAFQKERSLEHLNNLWIDPPGYYCRQYGYKQVRFGFTNYGISLGLQSVNAEKDKINKMHHYFEENGYEAEYERKAITHVMDCVSHFPGKFIRS